MADLRSVICSELSLLSQLPPEHHDRGRRLANVASKLTSLYKKTQKPEDLEQAVNILRAAVEATPIEHIRRPKRLHSLALSLGKLYRHSKSERHLMEAIETGREAVKAVSENQVDLAAYLSDFGTMIWDRYQTTDSIDDLHEFLQVSEEASKICTRDHPHRSKILNDVGVGLGEQYMKTGSLQDLQKAITFGQASVCETLEGRKSESRHLANLSVALGDRYLITGSAHDLESAIYYAEKAVEKTNVESVERGIYLNNLAVRYLDRYTLAKSTGDWQKALDSGKAAVAATHLSEPKRAVFLDNVAKCYHDGYKQLRTSDLLEQALHYTRTAILESRLPPDHTDQARRSFNLGSTLGVRYQNTGQIEDLEDSIRYVEVAVNGCPKDFPERARYLVDLGISFYERFQKRQDLRDLEQAYERFLDCLRQPNATPLQRLSGGRKAAKIAIEQQEWQVAAACLSQCVELVPRISSRSNSHDDLYHVLQQISGLGSLTAWVYIKAGKSVIESLQALEQCRGIISSLIVDSRSDVSLLNVAYPEVSARYCGLREAVARQGLFHQRGTMSFERSDYVSQSLKLAQDLENLENLEVEIRRLPGFSRFLLPPTEDEMLSLSRQGPIVSISLTDYGCQAFLVATQSIRYVELTATLSDVKMHTPWQHKSKETLSRIPDYLGECFQDDQESNAHQNISTQDAMIESMQWLWKAIVRPILVEVGVLWQKVPPSSLPCIWWVNSGEVALLPFHAAGSHTQDATENTLSHICSSYILTMKTLQHSRNMQKEHRQIDKILVVTMPTTPSCLGTYHRPLNVDDEVAAIVKNFGNHNSIEILQNPEPRHVLERLSEFSIVHFACHAHTNPKNPSQSALLLGKTTLAELTVEDIRSLDRKSAQMAYLSACSTAEVGAYSSIDEVIHLASTFQLAGFREVIGTMWEVDDSAAGNLAAKFYNHLLQQSPDSACRVSRALHYAVTDLKRELLQRGEGDGVNLLLWAPFVRFGP